MCDVKFVMYSNFCIPNKHLFSCNMRTPGFNLIVAVCNNNGIGIDGHLPWLIPSDMRHFRDVTQRRTPGIESATDRNAVIMGRHTWNSIPERFRPLRNRWNIIISTVFSQSDFPNSSEVLIVKSLGEAVNKIEENGRIDQVWIIGGNRVYEEAMRSELCGKIYLTKVEADLKCDAFFPEITEDFKLVGRSDAFEENGMTFRFLEYEKVIRWWWCLSSLYLKTDNCSNCFKHVIHMTISCIFVRIETWKHLNHFSSS